jgi:hypothetical protein
MRRQEKRKNFPKNNTKNLVGCDKIMDDEKLWNSEEHLYSTVEERKVILCEKLFF